MRGSLQDCPGVLCNDGNMLRKKRPLRIQQLRVRIYRFPGSRRNRPENIFRQNRVLQARSCIIVIKPDPLRRLYAEW